MPDESFPEPISFRLAEGEKARLEANARAMGSTKDIVLRELVRIFNHYCSTGRRPTFPFALASPGYVIESGRVQDATPSLLAAEEQSPYVASAQVKAVAQEVVKRARAGSAKSRSKAS